jgi:hypothetical protein
MAAGSLSAMDTGANIVVSGLVVQLLFFGFFVVVSAVFHWRVKKQPRYIHVPDRVQLRGFEKRVTWEAVMWALYAACLLILVRSVFRVVEFVEGNSGFIMRREYLLYIFDACLITLTGLVLVIFSPCSFLSQEGRKRDSGLQLFPMEEGNVHTEPKSEGQ